MNLEQIKTGDIFFYKGTRFVSKAICLGMLLYGKIIGRYKSSLIKLIDDWIVKDCTSEWIPSHCGTFIWRYYEDGSKDLFIAESVDNGFKIQNFMHVYDLEKEEYIIKTPVIPYTSDEVRRCIFQMEELARKSLMYNYFSIVFSWVTRILSWNVIILFSDREDVTACFESTSIVGKYAKPINWEDLKRCSTASIFEIIDNKHYTTKYE